MTSYYLSLAALWIGLGVIWLRRACMGVKKPLLLALFHGAGERGTRRARLIDAMLALAAIAIGIGYLSKAGYLR